MKILIADDKKENRLLLEDLLKTNDYTTVSTTNGVDALKRLKKEKFDAIISDLMMPKMDGFQLLRECKKDPALHKIPFIIYTATYTGKKDIEFGLSLGAVRYIIKPVEPDEFLAILNEVLAGISTGTLAEVVPEITSDAAYAAGHIKVLTEKMEKKIRALEEQREQYRILADNISDVIWLLDIAAERFVYVSPSVFALRGYTPEEVMAQPASHAITLKSAPKIIETLKNRIARFEAGNDALRVQRYEINQPRKDGTTVATEIVTTLLASTDRRVTRILGVTRDITERKQAADTLALTARKLVLMNDVTYQYIQNKITGLRGYVELSKDVTPEAERLSFIEKEEQVLADIHHLIKDTREYQEIGSLLPEWIPVEQSIRIASSLVSPGQGISVEAALHGLELYTDPLLEKIFSNLIDNTVKHGKTARRIRFSCEEKPDDLILICEDDGVGISPEIKARLFDRNVGENIRFGLFFVRECLLLSGMTIVETGKPGKGARFEIHVPAGMWRTGGKKE